MKILNRALRAGAFMDPVKCWKHLWTVVWLFVLVACGGGGSSPDTLSPTIAITKPTSDSTFDTNSTDVRLGGSISRGSFVHVRITTTGFTTEGYVNYKDGFGSWFTDVPGLILDDNVIAVTADFDGTGTRIATDTITARRPLQPASLIVNGASLFSATSYWTNGTSFGNGRKLALFSDGTWRSTTGSVLNETAGSVVNMNWAFHGPDVNWSGIRRAAQLVNSGAAPTPAFTGCEQSF